MKVRFAETDTKPKTSRRQSLVSLSSKSSDKKIAITSEDDAFDLWDHNRGLDNEKPPRICWKPALCPIGFICLLIVLVLFLPLSEYKDKFISKHTRIQSNLCMSACRIQLVESIPENLTYPDGSPQFMSTFDAWSELLKLAKNTLDIGSFYWTLRGADFYNHSSAWEGEEIFDKILEAGIKRKIAIRIAQSQPSDVSPNLDTEILEKKKAAKIRTVNMARLVGAGVLHTKFWIVDEKHFYIGSANMDWRSLTQVKELGVLVTNCSCLADDLMKIFKVYWDMGKNKSIVPSSWPKEYSTRINDSNPMPITFNNNFETNAYISSSPPQFSPNGRTQDIDAILRVIDEAEKFIHISVMDYVPLLMYGPKLKFWPIIDDALRKAAIDRRVSVKLLISYWKHSRSALDYFLKSIEVLSGAYHGVDIQVKRFIVPASDDQAKIPFGRVNHNKYMVTDKVAYIGTSNWSGDYFVDTAGVGLILADPENHNSSISTIRDDLASIFERDWNSKYTRDLINI